MEIYDRLRMVRDANGASQARFAAKFGVAQSTYGQWELGKRSIPDEFKIQLSEIGVNLHWLITGEGQMIKNTMEGAKLTYQDFSYITPSGKTYPIQLSHGGLSVPILASRVSAGNGEEWSIEDIREDERLPILARFIKPYDKEKIFAAEVRGDSMTGIQLFDGDFVFAVKDLTEGDGIYVISIDGEIFVKRVEYDPFEKKLRIISENERYQDKVVDSDRVILVGKVIGWLHHHPY